VVSASASVLVGRDFTSLSGLTKTLWIGTVAFLPGARCAEELQGTHPEHKNKPSEMKPDIVQTQSGCYKTIVVIKRQQQQPYQKKKANWRV